MKPRARRRSRIGQRATRLAVFSLLPGLLALVLAPRLTSQSKAEKPYVPQYALSPGEATSVGGMNWMSTLGYGRCDANANLYLRIIGSPSGISPHIFTTPLAEFSSSGEKMAVFSPTGAPGWAQGEFVDFTVGQDGTVYLLADRLAPHGKVETAILGFDQGGDHVLTAPLDLPVYAYNDIAVFSTGDFLVIGAKKVQSPPPRIPGTPVKAAQHVKGEPEAQPIGFVVHRDGRLIAEVMLPADPLSVDNGKAKGHPLIMGAYDLQGYAAVAAGSDGNIYAMFPASVPFVYAISPAGQIVHSFAVELPSPAYSAIGIKWATGLGGLLIESAKSKDRGLTSTQTLLSLVDPRTGQRIAGYRVGPKLGVLPACFEQGHIYFLGSDKGKFVFRQAEPR